MAIAFLEDHGRLLAPADFVSALLDGSADIAELESAGAAEAGRLHPLLDAARAAAQDPLCRMRLQRGGREGAVWVSSTYSAVVVPREDGRCELSTIASALLPEALARLNDVSPRPRIEPAVRLSLTPGELAAAISTRTAAEPALQQTLDGFREHWRIESRWRPAPGSTGVRVVEVIDSDAGLWLVVPSDPAVELWPTTPTMVFRMIAGLLPADHELER